MPVTDYLPYSWYDTPNIHHCTIDDFVDLVRQLDARMDRSVALDRWGRRVRLHAPLWFWNLFGVQGVFLLSRRSRA
jgi:methionine biosynthesis protein MetW